MPPEPIFEHEIDFRPAEAGEALASMPAAPGIVALFGHASTDRPHLLRAANLRRRLQRLLAPGEGQTKRLNLRERIARIAWRETASEFESLLLLYRAMSVAFGAEEARRRMRLSAPYNIRYAAENRFPRIYVTNLLRERSLHTTFGPFASRGAAERCMEAIEELFPIRRCHMELHPSPDDPGCIYGEMHKCIAPCQARCSDEQYAAEAQAALAFLQTHGRSTLGPLEDARDRASADMMFEEAAALHEKVVKAKATAASLDPLVQPLESLRAVLLMPCRTAPNAEADAPPSVSLYLFAGGCLRGPERVSLLGVRVAKEQAQVGSSLFAQPLMLSATPLADSNAAPPQKAHAAEGDDAPHTTPAVAAATAEDRMAAALLTLADRPGAEDTAMFADQLALLKRWYYRPEKQRIGALFVPESDAWPLRRMVRAAARIAASWRVEDGASL